MLYGGGGGLVRQAVDATNKTGAVELVNATQSWINNANRIWSGTLIRRYNRSIVRWPANWLATSITFEEQCTTDSFSDLEYSVVVDGAIFATVTGTGDNKRHGHTVTGLPIAGGGSTVEVWEPWNGKPGAQNTGADGPVEGGSITALWLPPGVSAPAATTASTAIITVGDSISGVCQPVTANHPQSYFGPSGQLRLLAEAKGWLVGSLDYGGACMLGDGLVAANYVTWIQEMVTALGATTVKVLYLPFRNDWANYGSTISSTPTQCATFLQTVINGLTTGYTHVVCTNIPQTDESANAGGFTLGAYRTAEATVAGATILDGTSFGISTSTDLADGVHMNALGVPKYIAGVKGALGL